MGVRSSDYSSIVPSISWRVNICTSLIGGRAGGGYTDQKHVHLVKVSSTHGLQNYVNYIDASMCYDAHLIVNILIFILTYYGTKVSLILFIDFVSFICL